MLGKIHIKKNLLKMYLYKNVLQSCEIVWKSLTFIFSIKKFVLLLKYYIEIVHLLDVSKYW